ncbi:MAG: GNAT family N-acetyltransferase, partial [bacterium]
MNILETERLVLCKFTSDDSEFILNLLNTPGWMKYIGDKGIKNLEDAQDYIRSVPLRSYDKYGFGLYLVKDKNDNTPLGMCGLIKREELEDVDL